MIDLLSTHDFYEYKMTRNLFEMCEQMWVGIIDLENNKCSIKRGIDFMYKIP